MKVRFRHLHEGTKLVGTLAFIVDPPTRYAAVGYAFPHPDDLTTRKDGRMWATRRLFDDMKKGMRMLSINIDTLMRLDDETVGVLCRTHMASVRDKEERDARKVLDLVKVPESPAEELRFICDILALLS